MIENRSRSTRPIEYYGSKDIVESYISKADDGLFEIEKSVINQHFNTTQGYVLDVGCGAGRTTGVLHEIGYDVTGVDLTKNLIDRAYQMNPEIDFSVGDACSLPFDDGTFEYVLFSFNGIDDILPEEKRYEAFREIRRVMKPGGVFSFSSHNLWSTYVVRSFDIDGIQNYLEFWLYNLLYQRLFSRYKIDNSVQDGMELRYYIRPEDQKQQLLNCGFDVENVVRPRGMLRKFFHHPYYVAKKPRE